MPPQPGPWPPSGQPPVPPQGPPPGYYPQQPGWGGPPPPKQNNTIKWLLIGVGLLLVIAITVGLTVLVTNNGNGGDGPSTTTSASGPPIASADDTGPVEIITLEPTCQGWTPLSQSLSQVQSNGWGDRDANAPASSWTATQRSETEAVAQSMVDTGKQAVALAKQTPNRVIRELYEQFNAYGRAYEASLDTYTAPDNFLALANIAASSALDNICNAITYGSAVKRSQMVPAAPEPKLEQPAGTLDKAELLVAASDSACTDLITLREGMISDTAAWVSEDPNIPSSEWSPERTAMARATATTLNTFAELLQSTGEKGASYAFQDIASLSALYFRAYAESLETYAPADNPLLLVGSRTVNLLGAACEAVK
jgi:hypothetical protein